MAAPPVGLCDDDVGDDDGRAGVHGYAEGSRPAIRVAHHRVRDVAWNGLQDGLVGRSRLASEALGAGEPVAPFTAGPRGDLAARGRTDIAERSEHDRRRVERRVARRLKYRVAVLRRKRRYAEHRLEAPLTVALIDRRQVARKRSCLGRGVRRVNTLRVTARITQLPPADALGFERRPAGAVDPLKFGYGGQVLYALIPEK